MSEEYLELKKEIIDLKRRVYLLESVLWTYFDKSTADSEKFRDQLAED